MPIILDGKKLSLEFAERLKAEVKAKKLKPVLAIVQVGELPASSVYIHHKKQYADRIGAKVLHVKVPESITEKKLVAAIKKLNKDRKVTGIIVQMPFPAHLDKKNVIEAVDPKKDVDGLHSVNAAKVFQDDGTGVAPATPKGVISLLKYYGIELEGKRAIVIGKSLLVGRPAAMLLLHENATVTIAHSRTKDLPALVREHDIVIVAVGRAGLVTKECVKKGQVIVDVGTNAVEGPKTLEEIGKKKLVGDVVYDEVAPIVHAISPVPGGVGPMTVATLFENLVKVSDRKSR